VFSRASFIIRTNRQGGFLIEDSLYELTLFARNGLPEIGFARN
jgi:hypothetical protein